MPTKEVTCLGKQSDYDVGWGTTAVAKKMWHSTWYFGTKKSNEIKKAACGRKADIIHIGIENSNDEYDGEKDNNEVYEDARGGAEGKLDD